MSLSKAEKDMLPFRSDNKKKYVAIGGIEVDPFLLSPAFQRWVFAILLSLLTAVLFEFPRMKVIDSHNFKIGDIAPEDVFANRDAFFKDQSATEEEKKRVSESTWAVFDYDSKLAGNIEKKFRAAFEDTRQFYQREWDWADAEKNRIGVLRTNGIMRAKAIPFIPDDDYSFREEEIKKRFTEMLAGADNKRLDIPEKMWSDFKKDRFSKETENKIATLFLQVLTEGVVQEKENLPTGQGEGITVRILPFNEGDSEFPKTDITAIHDLASAKKKVIRERAMSQYGKELSWSLRNSIIDLAVQLVKPNFNFNNSQTESARQRAKDVAGDIFLQIKKGERIVSRGEIISENSIKRLNLIRTAEQRIHPIVGIAGNFLWILTFISVVYTFSARNIRKFRPTTKDIIHISLLILLLLTVLKLVLINSTEYWEEHRLQLIYLLPLMAGAMIIRQVINSEVALIFSIVMAVIAGMLSESMYFSLYVFVGSIVGAEQVGQARTRSIIAKAGLFTGMANVVVVLAEAVIQGSFLEPATFYHSLFAIASGIIASFIVLGITPLVEYVFGYITDIQLLELANQEHPLLKALIINAPGTYQHSVTLGILAEEAAMAIHVNPLLVKVAALYHDIGKMEKPGYFVENQREKTNPHDSLNPSMSSLIIGSHVKYGIELAKMYRLPQAIIDVIPQHHGTSLMKFFYAKAKEKEDPELGVVDEKNFRYPGPKPQTREMAIVMLADSVEAAARSLHDPTPLKLHKQIRTIVGNIFNDGQLDECDLTLRDLNTITEAFTTALSHMYHTRPEYPELMPKQHPQHPKGNGEKKSDSVDTEGAKKLENGRKGTGEDKAENKKDNVRFGSS